MYLLLNGFFIFSKHVFKRKKKIRKKKRKGREERNIEGRKDKSMRKKI